MEGTKKLSHLSGSSAKSILDLSGGTYQQPFHFPMKLTWRARLAMFWEGNHMHQQHPVAKLQVLCGIPVVYFSLKRETSTNSWVANRELVGWRPSLLGDPPQYRLGSRSAQVERLLATMTNDFDIKARAAAPWKRTSE